MSREEEVRRNRLTGALQALVQDVRFALRVLGKRPMFTITAVLCLALGIGANTAIFSVVEGVLLRPLPYPHSDRLVDLTTVDPTYGKQGVSPAQFLAWREQCRSFEGLAAWDWQFFTVTGRGEPLWVRGAVVSPNLFHVLGVSPALGRGFLPSEEKLGHAPVAILGWRLFRSDFAADAKIIGTTLKLNGIPTTIVGVMPAGFGFPEGAELCVPPKNLVPRWTFAPPGEDPRTNWMEYFSVIGRLRPGVTAGEAQAETQTVFQRSSGVPTDEAHQTIAADSPLADSVQNVRSTVLVLYGSVSLVLLIACANVVNLLLALAEERRREFAVRLTLGAGRWRLVRQLLTESVLLALLGGGLGCLMALWGVAGLAHWGPQDIPRLTQVSVNPWVLLYLFAVCLAAGLLFGLLPTLRSSQIDLSEWLKEGTPASADRRTGGTRSALVIAEVALALVVAVEAGLLAASFRRLQEVHLGFDPAHVLSMRISLPPTTYPSAEQIAGLTRQILERARAIPGVQAASLVSLMPVGGWVISVNSLMKNGDVLGKGMQQMQLIRAVSPGYFQVLRIPVVKGRVFDDRDGSGAVPVAVINETMARRYWPKRNALGQLICPAFDNHDGHPVYREIVGIVGDVRGIDPAREPMPEIDVPYAQCRGRRVTSVLQGGLWMSLRTASDPLSLARAAKVAVWSADKDLPITHVNTMDQNVAALLARQRFDALLLGLFALLALLLAALGIYGVTSYSVAQRTHEIGIRIAVGADPAGILRLVARRGMALVLAGGCLGLIGVFSLTRLLRGLLYGVGPLDPLAIAGAGFLLAAVSLLACTLPARRAAHTDPMAALRRDG